MDLKPCPFCGSRAVAHGIFSGGYMMVRCMGCDASGPSSKNPVPDICIDIRPWIDEAIEAWNRRSPTPREQELREALEELANEVFGREVGSEPDVYADYDRLCELERKARAALTNGGAKSRKLNADRRWFLKRWDFGGWSPNILTAKKWKQCANWCVMAGFLEHDELMYRITDAGRYALTNGGAS